MDIRHLLSSESYIICNRVIAKKLGIYAALLLGDFASKSLYHEAKGSLTAEGYFYSTIEDTEEATSLSRHKQEEGIKALVEAGILEVKVFGIPPKRHFKLSESGITSQFVKNSQINLRSEDRPICEKFATNNNREYSLELNKEDITYKEETVKEESSEVLFPGLEHTKETEFKNSLVFDPKIFESCLKKEVALGIDVGYYYHSLVDWTEVLRAKDKRKRRTARGWIATARTFMRTDNQKGKLKMADTRHSDQEAIDYLKMGNYATD